jgi:cyclohexanecarboxylate-CoA ligase
MALATVNDRYSTEQIARYYAGGLWREDTMFGALEQQVAQRPDRVYLSDATTSCTFRELHDTALRLAAGLARRGIAAGDRVAVQIPNWTEFAAICLALSRIGAIIVPIMPIYRRDEVSYIVRSAAVKAVFTAGEFRNFDHARMFADLRAADGSPSLVFVVRGVPVPGTIAYADIPVNVSAEDAAAEIGPGASPDDPFVIVFSSGTTSQPKGCLHTFNTMACGARLLGAAWQYSDADVQFGPSPVTHTTGLVTSILLPLLFGAGSHIMEIWEPREGLERIAKFGCTGSVTATTFLQMLLNVYDPDVHDASSMRFWVSAGAPIPGSFIEAARRAIPNMAVLSLYGRTENVCTTLCALSDDPARSVTSRKSASWTPGGSSCRAATKATSPTAGP